MDVWSNHACQVALFFPSVSTACSGRSVNLVLPRPQKMHPSAAGTREPTGGVISKATQEGLLRSSRWSCCHWIGQGMHPTYLDKVRVREGAVGPSFSQTATSRVPEYGGDLQNEKKQRQRQATPSRGESPTGNHQITKLGDDQERRPFPKWRNTKGRELLASTKKTQWMRTAKKVKHRKPAPPMRKNRPEQKKYQKNRDSF